VQKAEHYYSDIAARLELLPAISGWKAFGGHVRPFQRNSTILPDFFKNDTGVITFDALEILVFYRRSAFVRIFAIMIVVFMWILSIYLLALSIDHVVFRPRSLQPDTVGYSVGMLFALPTMRLLLGAPLGSYIDYCGFAWNMLLVALAVFIFFSGSYAGGWRLGCLRPAWRCLRLGWHLPLSLTWWAPHHTCSADAHVREGAQARLMQPWSEAGSRASVLSPAPGQAPPLPV
jgi:hypothetical protein